MTILGCLLNFNALKYKPLIICEIKNCLSFANISGLCQKHYRQIQRHGVILSRTIYDRNEIEIKDNLAYISVYDKNCEVICKAIIDVEDVSKVEDLKWSKSNAMGYIFNSKKGRLHHVITGTKQTVDHINNDILDNRKSNLRLCSKRENNYNKVKPSNNTSGFKGVCLDKRSNKYHAYVNKDKIHYSLGYHDTPVLAAIAYNKKAIELFGEFANLNKI